MSIEAMQQALEALEGWDNYGYWVWPETALEQCKRNTKESLSALRQAIEQAEKQEPVAYIDHVSGKPKFINGYVVQTDYDIPLYTSPPRKEWVGLNWDDIPEVFVGDIAFMQGAKWALAKLKEKNT
jgi:hypothetical protein